MPDHKQMCKNCNLPPRPPPTPPPPTPTGKKCQKKRTEEVEGNNGQQLQLEILQQLQKVTQRLDQVEDRMSTTAVTSTPDKPELSSDTFLERIKPSKSKKSNYLSSS